MNDNILISIIIPAYQADSYIDACIGSLKKIEIKKEIFIVVDSWHDPTVKVCEKYTDASADIKIVLNDDKGMSEARNTGLRIAKGKYIWFVDADDWICGDFNTLLWKKLIEYKPEILMFDAGVVNETNEHWNTNNYIRKDKIKEDLPFSGIDFFNKYYLDDAYRTPVWLNIFSREYLEEKQLFFLKGYAHEDEDYTFRAIVPAKKIIYLNEMFYVRRYRQFSAMTSGFHDKQVNDFLLIMKSNTEFVHNVGDIAFQKIYKRYLYDRINLLIDRISVSDSAIKNRWYRETFAFFNEFILSRSDNADLSGKLMIVETVLHLNAVTNDMMDEEAEVLKDWCEGVSRKIDSCLEKGFGAYLGIYGTGKHTKMLLPVYEKVATEKKRKLVFIDSTKESYSEKYEGYDIVNIKDVDIDMEIIISSFFKQDEMYEMIRNRNVPYSVIKIYE